MTWTRRNNLLVVNVEMEADGEAGVDPLRTEQIHATSTLFQVSSGRLERWFRARSRMVLVTALLASMRPKRGIARVHASAGPDRYRHQTSPASPIRLGDRRSRLAPEYGGRPDPTSSQWKEETRHCGT